MGKHHHPGWTERLKLDPAQTLAQGPEYTESCALVLRDILLGRWVNDPGNAQWHPASDYQLRVEMEGDFLAKRHTTWLIGHMDAVYRPEGVPADVLDHVHTEDCEHVLVPFVTGQCCDHCGNRFMGTRLCAERCVATGYAVARLLEAYAPPGTPG